MTTCPKLIKRQEYFPKWRILSIFLSRVGTQPPMTGDHEQDGLGREETKEYII